MARDGEARDTGIGILPCNWQVLPLAEVVDPERGITYGIVQPGDHVAGGVPLIRGGDYSSGEVAREGLYHVDPEIAKAYSRATVNTGDLLLAIVGYVGQSAMVPPELEGANITQTTARIAIRLPHSSHFFLHYSKSRGFRREVGRYTKGSAQPGLNLGDVEKFLVPVPPAWEQKRIATILSSVDDAIAATRKVIEQAKRVRQGLLHTLMTRGIGHTRFKKTEIGEIPEAWEVGPLGKLASIRRGASPRPIRDPKWFSDAGAGWVRISDVTESDRFLRRTGQYLSPAGVEKSVSVAPGDVIMSICATIGIPVIVDMDACIHDGFVVFANLDCRVNPEFLRLFIEMKAEWLESLGQHGTQKNLNTGIVKSVLMGVPPRVEQDRIVEILLAAEHIRRRGERSLECYHTMKRGLMQDLLTGRVRVRPD